MLESEESDSRAYPTALNDFVGNITYRGNNVKIEGKSFNEVFAKSQNPDINLSTQDETSDIDRYYAETIAENRAFQMIFSNLENAISSQRTSYSLSQKEIDSVIQYTKSTGFCRCFNVVLNYFTMLATSAAKSSAFFSMPSPLAKRTNPFALMSEPIALATLAIYPPTLPW